MTIFRMAVNCRHRLHPKLNPLYFGDAIQSIPTYVSTGDVLSHDLHWCADQLNQNVKVHDDVMARKFIEDWEKDPQCFPLGSFDGAMLTWVAHQGFQCTIVISVGAGQLLFGVQGLINLMGRYQHFWVEKEEEVWIWR
ncbi:hypothetical protein BC332_23081 [Capsicum chinense]|nr:hypothetical protein BC332_23081 [Capsicum chinense]